MFSNNVLLLKKRLTKRWFLLLLGGGGHSLFRILFPSVKNVFFANSTPGTVDVGLKGFITSHLCDYKHGTDALRQNCQFTLTPTICSACNGPWRMVIGD